MTSTVDDFERTDPPTAAAFGTLYGDSDRTEELRRLVAKVAPSDATVLIVGESGCGKERVAERLHQLSERAAAPFVAVNCAAIPSNLVEAELFGFERGAFTGAGHSHCGVFERAAGGTLFLDEITEMPAEMQVRLLRVLETASFNRVGGDRELPTDVRVVAATNRDPLEAVASGALREDLLYRLAVFPIVVPPLRERPADILPLAEHFLSVLNAEAQSAKYLAPGAREALMQRSWTGNVRELRNSVQRAFILADDSIEAAHLESFGFDELMDECLQFEVGISLADMERRTIFATLDHCQGNKKQAARMLGVSVKTLYNRLDEYSAAVHDTSGGDHV